LKPETVHKQGANVYECVYLEQCHRISRELAFDGLTSDPENLNTD
jgi:hypothetical protein